MGKKSEFNNNYADLSPSPAALIESLRDIGYSMETAVADIIDNSITANARKIDLRFDWNDGTPWLCVIDDGHGMNREDLIAAMRFGCTSPRLDRSENDLGRFGLGMKTASFSQCRHLTVLSKHKSTVTCCEWDLDRISQSEDTRWLLHVLTDEEKQENVLLSDLENQYLASRSSGTIVLWGKIDRIDREASESQQEEYLNGLIADTQNHLELVFHRFLSPQAGKKKLRITFNGRQLDAFDPFNSKHLTTVELNEETFTCEGETLKVQPYVLPHHNKIDKEQYQKYGGKEGYLHNQGFYVYRNKRLIIKGTWFRLIKKAELTKLVRVRVDIPNTLDHLWKIDVKKSNAAPPEGIRNELRRIIQRIECSGKKVYAQRGQRLTSSIKTPAWNRRVVSDRVLYEINRNHPLVKQLHDDMEPDQKTMFGNLMRMFEGSFCTQLTGLTVTVGAPDDTGEPGALRTSFGGASGRCSLCAYKNAASGSPGSNYDSCQGCINDLFLMSYGLKWAFRSRRGGRGASWSNAGRVLLTGAVD